MTRAGTNIRTARAQRPMPPPMQHYRGPVWPTRSQNETLMRWTTRALDRLGGGTIWEERGYNKMDTFLLYKGAQEA